jgi:hypothetical protein
MQKGAIKVVLQNDGLEDLPRATLELWGTPPRGPASIVVSKTADLLAQTPITSTLTWAPVMAGRWKLTLNIRHADGQLNSLEPIQVEVQPARASSLQILLAASASALALPVILLVVIVFAFLAALTFWRRWGRATVERADDAA